MKEGTAYFVPLLTAFVGGLMCGLAIGKDWSWVSAASLPFMIVAAITQLLAINRLAQ